MQDTEKLDIHNTQETYERALKKLKDSDILPENKRLILDFLNEYCHGLSACRKGKYVIRYHWFARLLGKSFVKADRKDIKKLEKAIETKHPEIWDWRIKKWKTFKKKCSQTTIKDNKGILRLLYKWIYHSYLKHKKREDRMKGSKLRELLLRKSPPELVEDVIAEREENNKLKSKDMLSWEEVVKLSHAASHPQWKACIQLLGESGIRAAELLTLKLGDIEVKPINGKVVAVVHLRQSKTETRSLGIILSVPALVEWIKQHPAPQKHNPLFVKFEDRYYHVDKKNIQHMPYDVLRKVLSQAARKTGIKKRCNPHHLRKSRASFLGHVLKDGPELRQYFGWSPVSRAPKAYLFLDEEKTNQSYWMSQGVQIEDGKPTPTEELKPIRCECGHINPAGEIFCVSCNRNMDGKTPEEDRLRQLIREIVEEKLVTPG